MENNTQMTVVETTRAAMVAAGVEQTAGFGTEMTRRGAETAGLAVAAQARAAIEARCIMAMQRPRSWDGVRARLLAEARRPGFANVARYAKPIGGDKKAVGPSIRFAEAALRCMSNVSAETTVVYSDEEKEIVRVSVVDLETNVPLSKDIVVERRVERKRVSKGQKVYGQRTNSYGDTTFLVAATDDDMLAKEGALVSKALRTLVLRLLPGDILDDAMEQVDRTAKDADARDPGAARKLVVDSFTGMGVKPEELEEYLGHGIDGCSPAELTNLRQLFVAIRDGATTWHEMMAERRSDRATAAATTAKTAEVAPEVPGGTKGAAAAKAAVGKVKAAIVTAPLPGGDDPCKTCSGTGGVERDGKPLSACPDCHGDGIARHAPTSPST